MLIILSSLFPTGRLSRDQRAAPEVVSLDVLH